MYRWGTREGEFEPDVLGAVLASMTVAGKEVGAWAWRGDAGRCLAAPLPVTLRMEFEREDIGDGCCRKDDDWLVIVVAVVERGGIESSLSSCIASIPAALLAPQPKLGVSNQLGERGGVSDLKGLLERELRNALGLVDADTSSGLGRLGLGRECARIIGGALRADAPVLRERRWDLE